ncbi:phage integrase SAM-like domain-containing protein, partial [Bacteroidales bacterium OttesenSCG-928-B11]|nr:phage integrase SAM-like domain-containing protein [Bacteroidales bacterium OttesenSCG-928-B11]
MQIFENNTPPINFNYRPARLHEYKSGWLIEYYCENPTTNKLNRKTIKVNLLVSRYKNKREARQHINNIVSNINIKLSKGWNPFFEHEDSRLYSNINDVFAIYMQEKEKESRKHTLRSYSSFVSIIKNYINKNHPGAYSGTINHNTIAQFMDYVYNNRNVGQTTYNNYIKMGRALWNWMIEKCYTKENPFEKIKTKPKQKKKRIMIDKKTRNVIIDYLKEKNPNYLTICKLVYYSLIRPNEIQEIRIGDIDLKNHFIKITGDIAKNHKQRFAALTPDLIDDLKKININQYPAEYFLFS